MQLPDFLKQDQFGSIRFAGHRIDLAHLLNLYNEGYSAEMLSQEYPTLPLDLIQQTIAFCVNNQAAVEAYLKEFRRQSESSRAKPTPGPSVIEMRGRLESQRKAQGA